MRLNHRSLFLAFILLGLEPSHGHEASLAPVRMGSSESEIQAYLENQELPLDGSSSKEVRPFFKELGERSGFQFILAEEVQGDLRFESETGTTYLSFLNETLAENGLSWRRQPGTNWIWINAGLPTQRFSLSPAQRNHLEARAEKDREGNLRKKILGEGSGSSAPSDNSSYRIEGSELVVTDTDSNIRKTKDYLDRHKQVETLTAPLSVSYQPPPGLKKDLSARRFGVASVEDRNPAQPDANLRRSFQVEKTQRVLGGALYGNQSLEEAAAQGRAMHPNREDGSISIVDTPQNLRKVDNYLSGARYGSGGTMRIYEPQHRPAGDLRNAVNGIVLFTIP